MSNISQIVLNTMMYQMNNSSSSKTTSNPEAFSKLLQTSLMSSSSSECSCGSSSGISSLGMIVTLTGLLNQNKLYENTSSINNELESNHETNEVNNQNGKEILSKEFKEIEYLVQHGKITQEQAIVKKTILENIKKDSKDNINYYINLYLSTILNTTSQKRIAIITLIVIILAIVKILS